MPKNVINEYDRTQTVSSEYSNFSVVVPGYVSKDYKADVFDENGIYPCQSAAAFEYNVGKESAKPVAAVAPVITETYSPVTAEVTLVAIAPTESDPTEYGYKITAGTTDLDIALIPYTSVQVTVGTSTAIKAITRMTYEYDSGTWYYIIFTAEALGDLTGATTILKVADIPVADYVIKKNSLYTRQISTKTTVGYLVGEDGGEFYDYLPVVTERPVDTETYYEIAEDKKGQNAQTGDSYGNQMAYELLKQGYEVLYKKIDDITDLETPAYWEALKDKSAYDFRYITTGGYYNVNAYKQIAAVATFKNGNYITDETMDLSAQGRGDCIALLDVIEDGLTTTSQQALFAAIKAQVKGWVASEKWLNRYCAIFAPKVIYDITADKDYDNNVTFPASFHYLVCGEEAFITKGYSEWYAVAGYDRGKSVNYPVIGTTLTKFGDLALNMFVPRYADAKPNSIADPMPYAINLIVRYRNNYYIWGNRTAQEIEAKNDNPDAELKASHFLNIRQLCCTLKKELEKTCRQFTFDPNSDLLWTNFCNQVSPILDKMKADQGIYDYKMIKVTVTEKALVKAKVRIVPIEAVEDFWIGVYLENSIAGTTVGVDESDE